MWAETIADTFFQAMRWLDICGKNGIILNSSKSQFSNDIVEFAGFEITPTTVRLCARYLEAIQHFPIPQNITDVRSWFGLVNQVADTFAAAEKMLPFRELLKEGIRFVWTQDLYRLFNETKSRHWTKSLTKSLEPRWHRIMALPETLLMPSFQTLLLQDR